jgi:uncharacterized protein
MNLEPSQEEDKSGLVPHVLDGVDMESSDVEPGSLEEHSLELHSYAAHDLSGSDLESSVIESGQILHSLSVEPANPTPQALDGSILDTADGEAPAIKPFIIEPGSSNARGSELAPPENPGLGLSNQPPHAGPEDVDLIGLGKNSVAGLGLGAVIPETQGSGIIIPSSSVSGTASPQRPTSGPINPQYPIMGMGGSQTPAPPPPGMAPTGFLSSDLGSPGFQQAPPPPLIIEPGALPPRSQIGIPGLEHGLGLTTPPEQRAPQSRGLEQHNYGPSSSEYRSPNSTYHSVQEDCTMAMLAHLLGIATVFLGPFMIFMIMKGQSRFVAFHALQAVLFQCIITAGFAASFLLFTPRPNHIVFIGTLAASAVMGVISGLAANRGEWYEIPILGATAKGMLKE